MTRQEANREIAEYLILLIEKHPELRFGQIVQAFGFVESDMDMSGFAFWRDEIYLEPQDLLARIEHNLNSRYKVGKE
jgi:hypothetical protein